MNKEIIQEIQSLKQQRNAVLLVHNYQRPEVQDIADFVGDSLELSRKAAQTDARVIVFCGVHFMAETASILSPDKTVLLPDAEAGCPMANMINADQLRKLKAEHPGAVVVCYVNSSAEVKAESDYCCTSANSVEIVRSISPEKEIIFVPDKYLGQFTAMKTGRKLILWNGFCPTHVKILDTNIALAKKEHPQALVLAHPECTENVRRLADAVLSTGGMIKYVKASPADEFIIATETGILHRLQLDNPTKHFYPASEAALCPNMKKITLHKVLHSLQTMQPEVRVPEDIRLRAKKAIERMIEIAATTATK